MDWLTRESAIAEPVAPAAAQPVARTTRRPAGGRPQQAADHRLFGQAKQVVEVQLGVQQIERSLQHGGCRANGVLEQAR